MLQNKTILITGGYHVNKRAPEGLHFDIIRQRIHGLFPKKLLEAIQTSGDKSNHVKVQPGFRNLFQRLEMF